ncbi:anthranilate synthase component I family protein [Sungkyunkwania multivorans]|uniref:Anthranilate synthase component I family protein n=1 Tax=Sungkyunkwania multivorans TaxID=1173618 RepID=A0ABW3CTT6_9FLAO
MLRISKKIQLKDAKTFKNKLLAWAQQFEEVVWLDANGHRDDNNAFDVILAVDAFTSIKTDTENAFEKLSEYQQTTKDWLFGYLTYDLKNDTEKLTSTNFDGLCFPDLFFFQPKKIFIFRGNDLELLYLPLVDDEIDIDVEEIEKMRSTHPIEETHSATENSKGVKIKLRIHKDEYRKKVEKMLWHIQRGDIYEANFCQEFYAENTTIDPLKTYQHLNDISHPPFATFLKLEENYLLSASPERYLKKEGNRIISQPIKGTSKRSKIAMHDYFLKHRLANDPKERSENVMIVDLVRNDLSKTAIKGSVKVEELCRVYTFEQVHQMISTVVSEVDESTSPVDVIATTFPMGSMTGAPKVSAMRIIEDLEETKRGLYSGSVGYFTPKGDFDFNVVIRSILYNEGVKYVSYSVGGAITAKSIPEREYEECLIKAKAMREVLEG